MDSEEIVTVDEATLYARKKYDLDEYSYGLNRLDLIILRDYLNYNIRGGSYKDNI